MEIQLDLFYDKFMVNLQQGAGKDASSLDLTVWWGCDEAVGAQDVICDWGCWADGGSKVPGSCLGPYYRQVCVFFLYV